MMIVTMVIKEMYLDNLVAPAQDEFITGLCDGQAVDAVLFGAIHDADGVGVHHVPVSQLQTHNRTILVRRLVKINTHIHTQSIALCVLASLSV